MKQFLFLLAFLLPTAFGFSSWTAAPVITCSTPQDVTKTDETATSISFSWRAEQGVSYKVKYSRTGFTSGYFPSTGASYTFSNLTVGGEYTFYFYSVCGEETSLPFIVIDDISGG